jgi:uncharacterized protein YciI
MYIINLTYHKPLDEVETLLPAHRQWLQKNYQQGIFLASGRKEPRTGGIILAKGIERSTLNTILAADPFNAVANYDVTEFIPSMTVDGLALLQQ